MALPFVTYSAQINRHRVAVVLSSAGGQIGVFEVIIVCLWFIHKLVLFSNFYQFSNPPRVQLGQAGRLDKSSTPTLQNSSNVMDFAFDPFDACKLVVGETAESAMVCVLYCLSFIVDLQPVRMQR